MPGMGELLILLAIVLVIFGAGKLPAIGDAFGRTIKNFRRGVGGADEIEVGDAAPANARLSRPNSGAADGLSADAAGGDGASPR